MNGTLEYNMARAGNADRWVPANGGSETPVRYRSGKTLLYVFNFATGKHAFLDCGNDTILTDEEALTHIGT